MSSDRAPNGYYSPPGTPRIEQWRRRYDKLREAGSCVRCGAEARPNRVHCADCAQVCSRAQVARYRPRGPRVVGVKLTALDVRAIRERIAGRERCASVARAFGVSESLVRQIVTRKTWSHVP